MRRIDLYKINFSGVLLLAAGFIASLIIPKIAISAMGIDNYGTFAIILGVSLVPSFFELGLTPGLTREMGSLYAQGRHYALHNLTRKFQLYLGSLGLAATIGAAVFTSWHRPAGLDRMDSFMATLAGGGTNTIMLLTEIGLIRVRVAGGIVAANIARIPYYVIYLVTVMLLALYGNLNIKELFMAQFIGACAYILAASAFTAKYIPAIKSKKDELVTIPWRRLFFMAAPEQVNRVQSNLVPGFERTMLHEFGGAKTVSAYDIALRLSMLVTALPSTFASPLVALLSPNAESGEHSKNRWILRHVNILTWLTVVFSSIAALLIVKYFAVKFYHLEESLFLIFSVFVFAGSGLNVLTASYVAFFYAHNKPAPVLVKSSADLLLAAAGILTMLIYSSPLYFVMIRYLGYGITSSGFLLYYRVNRDKFINKTIPVKR